MSLSSKHVWFTDTSLFVFTWDLIIIKINWIVICILRFISKISGNTIIQIKACCEMKLYVHKELYQLWRTGNAAHTEDQCYPACSVIEWLLTHLSKNSTECEHLTRIHKEKPPWMLLCYSGVNQVTSTSAQMAVLQQPLQYLCSTDAGEMHEGEFFYYSCSLKVWVRGIIESNISAANWTLICYLYHRTELFMLRGRKEWCWGVTKNDEGEWGGVSEVVCL